MRIIIAPAKRMRIDTDTLVPTGLPVFMERTEKILKHLSDMSPKELKSLWKCNDKIAEENVLRLQHMDLYNNLTPSILAYDGIAYQYMAPIIFEDTHFDYAQEYLRILSAFYGVLKPMDGITPYRLEMMAKAKISGYKNLYDFWGDLLYREVRDDSGVFINLSSKEYSRCIEEYLVPEDTVVSYTFGELKDGNVIQKTVHVKMARGEMVRFMAEKNITDASGTKGFNRLGFSFDDKRSTETHYVFLK